MVATAFGFLLVSFSNSGRMAYGYAVYMNTNPLTAEFTIDVIEDAGIWIAECDAIGRVTEAASFEDLTRRVVEIAPELNGYPIEAGLLRLRFDPL